MVVFIFILFVFFLIGAAIFYVNLYESYKENDILFGKEYEHLRQTDPLSAAIKFLDQRIEQ